ncbi:MAG: hypothetical protein JXB50_08310 [Spirochaetes bacterium]|nr:hypothetical protein [Spirochaetota bacterium]
MTKRETNKYTMYKSLMTVLNGKKEKIEVVEGLKTASEELSEIIAKISETDNMYKNLTKGARDDKMSSKEALSASILKTANVLYVHAKKTDNFPLKEKSDFTRSELKRIRENELLQKAKIVVENAEQNAGEITSIHKDFNDELKNLKELLTAFEESIGKQSSKSTEKQASREALTEEFKTADDIIKEQLDPLIELIREKDIDLYNQYFAARTIKDLGVRKAVKEEEINEEHEEEAGGDQNIKPADVEKEENLKN